MSGESKDIKRPSLGPLFPAALATCCGAMLAEELAWRRYAGLALLTPKVAAVLVAGALAVVAAAMFARRRGVQIGKFVRSAVPLFGAAFLASLACGSMYWDAWSSDVQEFEDLAYRGVELELVSDSTPQQYGVVSVASARLGNHDASVRVTWPDGVTVPSAGHVVCVTGRLKVPDDSEGGRWNHRNGYLGMLAASSFEERGYAGGLRGFVAPFRDRAFEAVSALGGDSAALLAGVLLGNRTLYAGTELEQDFRTTGLAHLMAVSGTHLAVVTALASWVLARSPLRRPMRSCLLSALLVGYVALTCFAPSALRACVMCIAALLSGLVKRRKHVFTALFVCVVCFVMISPQIIFSLGFQLSALAVFGIVMFTPLAAQWISLVLGGRFSQLSELVAVTLAASVVTLPATLPTFAQLPIISPLSSLLASPLVTVALGLGMCGILCVGPLAAAGLVLLHAAGVVSGATAALVRQLADVPGACIPVSLTAGPLAVVAALAVATLWVVWPQPNPDALPRARAVRRGAATLALVSPLAVAVVAGIGAQGAARFVYPQFDSSAQVVMIDVGQGDAMLIRDGASAVLVDTGKEKKLLEQGLARCGVTHLNAVYLTHKDADHCGALKALAGVVQVDHVYVHADLVESPDLEDVAKDASWVTKGRGLEGVRVGDVTHVGSFSLRLIAPKEGGRSENEDSLVNLLEYDADNDGMPEFRGLLTGDAEAEATRPLVKQIGDIDFLKVAHHGSKVAHDAEELSFLKPEIALIGVGEHNDYGHPRRETLTLLNEAGAKVYRTDQQGDITVSFSATALSVKTQK